MNAQTSPAPESARTMVTTSGASEVEYWTSRWNVSVHNITNAIRATGTLQATAVESYLRKKGYIKQLS